MYEAVSRLIRDDAIISGNLGAIDTTGVGFRDLETLTSDLALSNFRGGYA